jgi:hypothetical protein
MRAKKQKKKSSPQRRAHSSLDRLPNEVQSAVKLMIVGKRWPADFKDHYSGTPRYKDVVEYCKAKGHVVTESSVGRYAQRAAPLFNQDVCELDSVWLLGIQSACLEYCVIVDDLIDCLVDPGHHPEAAHALPRIQEQAINQLGYLGRAIQAVKPLDSGGSTIRTGARKRSTRQPGAK